MAQKFSKENLNEIFAVIKKNVVGTRGIIWGVSLFSVIFLTVIIVQSCTPQKGGIIYGMCHAFLEQQIPFPDTIKHSRVEQYRKAVRIYFTHTDSFGQYQLEMIECSFMQHPQRGVQLESVIFDRIRNITKKIPIVGKGKLFEVEQDVIDKFNQSNSPAAIMSQDPDLSLPKRQDYSFN